MEPKSAEPPAYQIVDEEPIEGVLEVDQEVFRRILGFLGKCTEQRDKVKPLLDHDNAILIGKSGVGKSTIAAAVFKDMQESKKFGADHGLLNKGSGLAFASLGYADSNWQEKLEQFKLQEAEAQKQKEEGKEVKEPRPLALKYLVDIPIFDQESAANQLVLHSTLNQIFKYSRSLMLVLVIEAADFMGRGEVVLEQVTMLSRTLNDNGRLQYDNSFLFLVNKPHTQKQIGMERIEACFTDHIKLIDQKLAVYRKIALKKDVSEEDRDVLNVLSGKQYPSIEECKQVKFLFQKIKNMYKVVEPEYEVEAMEELKSKFDDHFVTIDQLQEDIKKRFFLVPETVVADQLLPDSEKYLREHCLDTLKQTTSFKTQSGARNQIVEKLTQHLEVYEGDLKSSMLVQIQAEVDQIEIGNQDAIFQWFREKLEPKMRNVFQQQSVESFYLANQQDQQKPIYCLFSGFLKRFYRSTQLELTHLQWQHWTWYLEWLASDEMGAKFAASPKIEAPLLEGDQVQHWTIQECAKFLLKKHTEQPFSNDNIRNRRQQTMWVRCFSEFYRNWLRLSWPRAVQHGEIKIIAYYTLFPYEIREDVNQFLQNLFAPQVAQEGEQQPQQVPAQNQ